MKRLSSQKCYNHRLREAAARCPECGRHFCRECVTEHEGRVLCAMCIEDLLEEKSVDRRRFAWLVHVILFMAGYGVMFSFFFLLGRILLSLPDEFHEGTLWTGALD